MRKVKFLLPLFFTLLFSLAPSSICAAPGDLDLSFGTNGFALNNLGIAANEGPAPSEVTVQPDGKIVIGGSKSYSVGGEIASAPILARFNSDGTLDNSFGTNGVVSPGFFLGRIASIVIQPNGKLVVGGSSNGSNGRRNFFVVRYNPNGTSDASFNNGAMVSIPFSSSANLVSVLLQPDGKIVAAGGTSNGSFAAARCNADGSFDSSFDEDGKVEISFPNLRIRKAALQSDGKIVIAGSFVENTASGNRLSIGLLRFNADGLLDTSFGNGGKVVNAVGENAELTSVALQSDGKIVGAGYVVTNADYKFVVVRYDSTGLPDSTFGTNGVVITNLTDITNPNDGSETARAVLIQRNGKIIVVGASDESDNNFALVRYNPNGTLDTNFGQGGKLVSSTPQNLAYATAARLQPDGKIVVVGLSFNNSPNNSTRNFLLARYLGDAASRFDFDGDGKSDLSVFRRGIWHLQRSQSGFNAVYWGIASDKLAPADFDGDGKTDVAVYRPSNGEWSILRSSDSTARILNFGIAEDLPRPADFDGDGKADIAVFRPSNGTWYRINSSSGQFSGTQFGQTGDVPLIADFDGDGKSDIAVFRPSNGTWYWLRSSDSHFIAFQFGSTEDAPVAADFDGDGKTDLSVYRPSNGTWYYLRSADGHFLAVQFGQAGDAATAGDYDGDGRAEMAVFRESNGVWYRLSSGNGGAFSYEQFGTSGDRPVPAAFLP